MAINFLVQFPRSSFELGVAQNSGSTLSSPPRLGFCCIDPQNDGFLYGSTVFHIFAAGFFSHGCHGLWHIQQSFLCQPRSPVSSVNTSLPLRPCSFKHPPPKKKGGNTAMDQTSIPWFSDQNHQCALMEKSP